MSGAISRALVLLGAFGQVAASWYVSQRGSDAFTRTPPGGDPPFIPATYAFAIWGPIFLACIAALVLVLTLRRGDRPETIVRGLAR